MPYEIPLTNELNQYFARFVRERQYVANVSPKTLSVYHDAWKAFRRFSESPTEPEHLSKDLLTDFIVDLRSRGRSTTTVNMYVRVLNTFCNWLLENEIITERVKAKQLKEDQKKRRVLDEDYLAALVSYKPKDFVERRIQALLLLLIDTGMRVTEALTLTPEDLDLDHFSVKVMGKGRKERVVPISLELRKMILRYVNERDSRVDKPRFFFCNRNGGRLLYDNARRDYGAICQQLKIEKAGGFHRVRHTFATNYLKNGGNVLYLQTILGHASVNTTRVYVEPDQQALQDAHTKTSILARLRRA